TETICLQPIRTCSAASRCRRSPRCTPTSASADSCPLCSMDATSSRVTMPPPRSTLRKRSIRSSGTTTSSCFDLSEDPEELHNLALERDKYKDTILRMNALLNDLMAKEVGKNDGAFLPAAVRPKQTVVFDKQ